MDLVVPPLTVIETFFLGVKAFLIVNFKALLQKAQAGIG